MYTLARRMLRVDLLVLLLGSVLAQLLVPVAASQEASFYPEVAYLEVPYSVAAILFIGCIQVAVVALWSLLARVDGGSIFSRPAVRRIDVITACAAIAMLLSAGVFGHLLLVVGAGGIVFYILAACVVGAGAVVLVMIVARGVLLSVAEPRSPAGAA